MAAAPDSERPTRPPSPRERTEWQAVFRRALALSSREQLSLYAALREYLGVELEAENTLDQQLRRRIEALEAMEKVAAKLKLPAGRAPTAQQFNETAKELGLSWNSTAVLTEWGRWRNATRAFLGERVPQTREQRAIRSRIAGKQGTHETYIAGVTAWLKTEPPSKAKADYVAFIRQENSRRLRAGDGELPLLAPPSLLQALNIEWDDIVRCANNEIEYAEVAATRAREQLELSGPLRLVGTKFIALTHGISQPHAGKLGRSDGFPTTVARLNGKSAWMADDILAHKDGRPFPRRTEGAMQRRIYSSADIAKRLGVSQASLIGLIGQSSPTVPQPQGRIGQDYYWTPAAYRQWSRSRDRKAARKRSR